MRPLLVTARRSRSRIALTVVSVALPIALAASCGDSGSATDTPSDDAAVDDSSNETLATDESGADIVAPSETTTDTAAAIDTTPPPCSGPGASPDPWSMLGHDGKRTSASNGCIHASLTESWRFDGKSAGEKYYALYNAVGDKDAVYVHAAERAPTVARVDASTGKQAWRYAGPADYDLGNWLTLGFDTVLVDDDGVYLLAAADGKLKTTSGVDWWGQTAADDKRFYVVTTTHGDGPGAFVGGWDLTKGLAWKANEQGSCDPALGDTNGALAVDAGVVYFAPRYVVTPKAGGSADAGTLKYASGLYAIDAATGSTKWSVPLSPQSSISLGDGHVYLIEPGPSLVARKTSDGAIAWSAPLATDAFKVGSQPPLLARGSVVIAAGDQVRSFDAATGKPGWTATIARASFTSNPGTSINFVSCPSAGEPAGSPLLTTLAAATASNTLIVTGGDAIHVLSLDSGAEQGKVALANAWNPIVIGDQLYVIASGASGTQLVAYRSK